jgi:alcohol dehydrogenase class IV
VREHRHTVVIGLEGGSALDAAKAIAVAAVSDQPLVRYIWGGVPMPATKIPLVALPTTAGTGSEVSRGAILTEAETGRKSGLRGEICLPTHALVDPELSASMPASVTAETGFDAWAHANETYLSRKANPFTEALSIGAMERIAEFLSRAVRDGSDRTVRAEMAAASLMMGWNPGLATTCLPHPLQHPLGAKTDSSHARGIAALHLAWLRQVAPFAVDKLARVSGILGKSTQAASVVNGSVPISRPRLWPTSACPRVCETWASEPRTATRSPLRSAAMSLRTRDPTIGPRFSGSTSIRSNEALRRLLFWAPGAADASPAPATTSPRAILK